MTTSKPLILLMRHAKSDEGYMGLDDFDRPLSPRGLSQIITIAEELNKLKINIDQALVSPALRTRQTYEVLAKYLKYKVVASFDKQLYNAHLHTLLKVLQDQADPKQAVLVIAHNPGISHLLNFLSAETHEFATAELAILSPKQKTALSFDEHSFICEKIITPSK